VNVGIKTIVYIFQSALLCSIHCVGENLNKGVYHKTLWFCNVCKMEILRSATVFFVVIVSRFYWFGRIHWLTIKAAMFYCPMAFIINKLQL
jgi:hypothetical protein